MLFRCDAQFSSRTQNITEIALYLDPVHARILLQVDGKAPALSHLPWYDGGTKKAAFATEYEVKMLALALVNYGNSVSGAQEDVQSLMQRVIAGSKGYIHEGYIFVTIILPGSCKVEYLSFLPAQELILINPHPVYTPQAARVPKATPRPKWLKYRTCQ